jgi:hypothetical protein
MSIIIVVCARLAVLCYSLEAELNRLFWTLQTTHYFVTSPEDNKVVNALLLTYLTISVIRSSGHRA